VLARLPLVLGKALRVGLPTREWGAVSEADFYWAEPTAHASWRWAVLMGANSRTYKFPLGDALLELAASGRDAVTLEELAARYAMGIVRRVGDAPQASERTPLAATDFLTVAKEEASKSLALGQPSGRLVQAAVKSIPGMVMDKFHNVRGGELPHTFYSLHGRGRDRMVQLSQDLRRIAASPQVASLRAELDARWSIVETSFTTGVGRSVMEDGLAIDFAEWRLTDKRRRRSVAGVKEAVVGFQHGRCLTCGDIIWQGDRIAIDHVFPLALMDHFPVARQWPELDLDRVWNLAPAHYDCNAGKSARPPRAAELSRLVQRNEAIMNSPHPLKRTLEITLGPFASRGGWPEYVRAVLNVFS
jgi:5-methylcytosine-specific restriction endonuclease McrA